MKRDVLEHHIGVEQRGRGRGIRSGEGVLQSCRGLDQVRRRLGGDVTIRQIRGEVLGRGPELEVQIVVERRAVPVVDPAHDLAVGEVDGREDPQLAAEELGRVDHAYERTRLVGQDLRGV